MMTKITVNGVTYDSADAMPPDVRVAYQRAVQAMGAGGPTVKTSEVKLSFHVSGPGFSFHQVPGMPSALQPMNDAVRSAPTPYPTVGTPIEPSSVGGGIRSALILAACIAGALMLWLLARGR